MSFLGPWAGPPVGTYAVWSVIRDPNWETGVSIGAGTTAYIRSDATLLTTSDSFNSNTLPSGSIARTQSGQGILGYAGFAATQSANNESANLKVRIYADGVIVSPGTISHAGLHPRDPSMLSALRIGVDPRAAPASGAFFQFWIDLSNIHYKRGVSVMVRNDASASISFYFIIIGGKRI
jgi:hypothetical protein